MDYYSQKLYSSRLQKCYEIASPRIKQYLEAEIDFVLQRMKPTYHILEIGCGYGRVLEKIINRIKTLIGIDISLENIKHARSYIGSKVNCHLYVMNAVEMGFRDNEFDAVICVQNGISAFNVDQSELVREAVRVTRNPGIVLFSSYSEKFWEERLNWFRDQSRLNLIGEIDENASGNGVIICKDGFKATTISKADFLRFASIVNVDPEIYEIDESSLFCEMRVM
jgi:2-polyprenyl-6-hydroxyphenyl methylase/3-demethylubiquinone-9 3-methyltransferase